MAVFRWYNGNGDMLLPEEYPHYSPTVATATEFVLQFQDSIWPIDPFKIVFTIANGVTYTDSYTGLTHYTAGTVTSVTFEDQFGGKLADMTGLSVNAHHVLPLLFQGYSVETAFTGPTWDFWASMLFADTSGATITGSENSGSGSPTYWGEFWKQARNGDTLETTRGNDTVYGLGGSDYISDRGGADVYKGGSGILDLVSYSRFRPDPYAPKNGIVADLARGRITGGDGLVDRVSGIEAIRATIYDDVLLGNAANNAFFARGGTDVIDGRGGFDTVHYASGGVGGVLADLSAGTVRDVTGSIDQLTSIEGVVGTNFNDVFIDAAGNQRYEGMGDVDHFTLAGGNDTVIGGLGSDVFKFVGQSFGVDRIKDFAFGDPGEVIQITGASGMSGLVFSTVGDDLHIGVGGSSTIIVEDGATFGGFFIQPQIVFV